MSIETDNQAVVEDKFTFLRKLTSGKKHHGNKSFYQHLCNVYGYLESQSAPEEVCDAGLFHAIYGTEFYDFQNAAVTREVVRDYIGEYAEELVYIFCGLRNGRFRSIVNNTPGWSAEQHLDLCWVEFANLLDHKGFRDVEERLDILGQTIRRLEAETVEKLDFLPPPFPPRLLSLDQVAFLSHNGWLPIDLSGSTQSAFQNVISEAQSFFAQEADVKQRTYPSGSISNTQYGFYSVPEEKEYVTFRYRTNPESPFEDSVEDAWKSSATLLHRILCDLACFHGYDPRMWDSFLEDTFKLPQSESSMTDHTTFMRIFQYYPGGVAEQHTDLGLLTLCLGTDSSLEVVENCADASRWTTTDKPIVLVGRMASMLLQRRARAGRHRVVSNPQGRNSVVVALRPCLRAEINPGPDGQEAMSAREYFAESSTSRWNINAKKDVREEQRQNSKLRQGQQLDTA